MRRFSPLLSPLPLFQFILGVLLAIGPSEALAIPFDEVLIQEITPTGSFTIADMIFEEGSTGLTTVFTGTLQGLAIPIVSRVWGIFDPPADGGGLTAMLIVNAFNCCSPYDVTTSSVNLNVRFQPDPTPEELLAYYIALEIGAPSIATGMFEPLSTFSVFLPDGGVGSVVVSVRSSVPEPSSLLLLASGLAGLAVWRFCKKAI